MTKKCTKYESLVTFGTDEALLKHLEVCEDCRKEHQKMQRVSELLEEVKPYYRKKRINSAKIKVACALFIICLCTTTLGIINFNTDISDTIKYGYVLSAEDLGFPTDSYGLIMAD